MDLPIKCAECGGYIDGSLNGKGELEVDLCSACQDRIATEKYNEGYDEGYDKGYSEKE